MIVRVPFAESIERHRIQIPGGWTSERGDDFGAFAFRRKGIAIKIIASAGSDEIPWEHVSVSTPHRCPTWEEMCFVKDIFWRDDETVVQYHPAKSDYVNHHPFCLHMWRPWEPLSFPKPPMIAVGPKGGG